MVGARSEAGPLFIANSCNGNAEDRRPTTEIQRDERKEPLLVNGR